MGMLDRYKKKGGFKQLLKLIETCAPQKQNQLLTVIKQEDNKWAILITKKMLTMEIIFSWPAEVVGEFTHLIPPRTLAIAIKKLTPEALEKACVCLPHIKKREVQDFFESLKPSPGEVLAAATKVIEKVRELTDNGTLKFDRFAPELTIDEDAA